MSAMTESNAGVKVNLGFLYNLEFQGVKCVLDWCMANGLIANQYKCPKCGCDMHLVARKGVSDGYAWRCRVNAGENSHDVKRSVRKGSWFDHSCLPLLAILKFTLLWLHKCPATYIKYELGVSSTTVADWKMFCREVCVDMCVRESEMLGGAGVVVEIAENMFSKKKYNMDDRVAGKWVFGGVEKGTNKCFFRVVENGKKEMLLDVIRENVRPGSVIISDCWKKYDCLCDEGFIHLQVNNSFVFKDPETGSHMNSIKGTLSAVKRSIQGTRLVTDQFDSYLAEYIWKRKHQGDPEGLFSSFLKAVSLVFPPSSSDLPSEPGTSTSSWR